MGMGDAAPPFRPWYEPIRDDVAGKRFASCMMRSCPEPRIIARFGVGGVANVSVYTCRRCRFVRTYKWHGGVSCTYGMAECIPPGT